METKILYGMSVNGAPIGLTEGVSVRFVVEKEHVGFIIGRGGGNVKRMKRNTNTQILIQDPDEKSGGKPWFLVRGLFKKNVSNACTELAMMGNRAPKNSSVYDVPNDADYEIAEVKCSYLLVHKDHVGIIVGKGGSNVTRISRENGAFIYAQKACEESSGLPWFQIKGLYEKNIEDAYFALVNEAQRAESVMPRFGNQQLGPG
jgi:transcription antitermination factor NusA-like protein|tara:strand:- start:950 stop:1558 length:609 start_codon:yes stop_codon:yes gene_type:complete